MTVSVKICGIRSEADLTTAVAAGADSIGFICGVTHYSEDALSPRVAARLGAHAREMAATVRQVLVTHLDDPLEIFALAATIGVDAVQVHGLVDLPTQRDIYERATGLTIVRAIHVTDSRAIDHAEAFAPYCDTLLLDTRTGSRLGGTGSVHDWRISAQIVDRLGADIEVVLAGGLRPSNVGAAMARVRPHGVDVNSGVEDGSGNKSPAECAAFVQAAREKSHALEVQTI